MALTAKQLEIRGTGIGSSEIAAVAGLSPWMRPIDVWEKKLGIAPEADNHNTRRGNFLEEGLRRWYAAETGLRVEPGATLRHPSFQRVLATPDGLVYEHGKGRAHRVLELKSPAPRSADHWGEAGTDQIPEYYIPQVIWEMACAEVDSADVAALIGGELNIYTVRFDADLFGQLVEIANRFWIDHVETKTPPPVEGTASYTEYLKRRFPRSVGVTLTADPNIEALAQELREIEALEERAELIRNEIKAYMEEADTLDGSAFRITYRTSKDRESVAWKALCAELKPDPELVRQFTKTAPGPRSFRVTWK